jgi:hypothetical protein
VQEKVRPHPAVSVAISTLSAGLIKHQTFSAWNSLIRYDAVHDDGTLGCRHVANGGSIELLTGPRVAEGRSQIVDTFLTDPIYKNVDWLFMIDSDMTFEQDSLCQLLGHAYSGNRKAKARKPDCYIIGGLCFAGGRSQMYPTIYAGAIRKAFDGLDQVVPEPVKEYPRNSLIKVLATGAAFMLVHRQVLQHMAKPFPDGFSTDAHGQPNPHPWFVEGLSKGVQFGEDIAFCMRASSLGYPTYVHTGVRTGHIKTLELNEELWDEYQNRTQKPKTELRLP